MKKTLVAMAAVAATGTAFAAGHAAPASSVTLFGIVDAGIAHVDKNAAGASFNGMATSNIASSQFGMRGSESLGGGLRAIFELAADINPENGTFDATAANSMNSGALFRRGSYVGLAGGFGQITFGRRLNPFIIGAAGDQILGANSTNTARAVAMNYADFWTKNAITYVSPNMSGLTIHAQHGLSNVAGRAGDGTITSLVAVYGAGPLSATAGYEKADGGLSATEAAATSGISTVVATPLVGKKEASFLTGKYTMGAMAVGAGVYQVKAAGAATRDGYSINLGYNFSKQMLTSVSFNDYEGTEVVTLQGRYILSPRTSLYGLVNSIDNGKVTTFVPTWGARGNARPGAKQTAMTVGIIHSF